MNAPRRERHAASVLRLSLDANLRCVMVNGEGHDTLRDLPASALVGKPLSDFLAPSESPDVLETLGSAVREFSRASIVATLEHEGRGGRYAMEVLPVEPMAADATALEIILHPKVDDANIPEALRGAEPGKAAPGLEAPGNAPASGRVEMSAIAPRAGDETARASDADARFRTLAESASDGLVELDEEGRVLFASPSYAEQLGVERRGLIGSDPGTSVHPDDRRKLSALLRSSQRARGRSAVVYRAQHADGSWLDLEATARRFKAPDGHFHVSMSVRDVTERERARRALERQIELETRVAEISRFFVDIDIEDIQAGIDSRLEVVARLAAAQHCWLYSFSTGQDGMELFNYWASDSNGHEPVPASRSVEMFPYSTRLIMSGQVYHVPSVDDLPEQAAAEHADMLRRGIRSILGIPIMSGGEFVGCLGFESLECEVRWSEETIMLLRMAGEIFYSTLRRRRAVRDLQDSQDQLLQAQKMEAVGTLAGGIAHDFNNHLAVMLSNARFVRESVDPALDANAEVVEAISDVERAAEHCAQLTRSLLAFSRRGPVEVGPVEVAALVRGVEDLVRPLLPVEIELTTDLAPDLGSFAVDRVQIQQVLVNLLVNARDAMPDGGPVRLSARRRRVTLQEAISEGVDADLEYVVLCVEDSGCGLDPAIIDRVFEPFFTTKAPGQGTGLGLAMAYGIVAQSGGAISVESVHGEGATFRIFLPSVSAEVVSSAAAGKSEPAENDACGRARILLFEPDREVSQHIVQRLSDAGHCVETLERPDQIAERVRRASSDCDLVIGAQIRSDLAPIRFAEVLRGGDDGPPILLLSDAADFEAPESADVAVIFKGDLATGGLARNDLAKHDLGVELLAAVAGLLRPCGDGGPAEG